MQENNVELNRLIGDLLSGDISPEDFDALECILLKSEAARKVYLERVALDSMLFEHYASPINLPNLVTEGSGQDTTSFLIN